MSTWQPGQRVNVAGAFPGQLQPAEIVTIDTGSRLVRIRYLNTGAIRDVATSRLRRIEAER